MLYSTKIFLNRVPECGVNERKKAESQARKESCKRNYLMLCTVTHIPRSSFVMVTEYSLIVKLLSCSG